MKTKSIVAFSFVVAAASVTSITSITTRANAQAQGSATISATGGAASTSAATSSEQQIDTSKLTTLPPDGVNPNKLGPEDAPPPPPHKKGIVLDSTIGAFGFVGQFRKVAPTAPWLHLQGGYEIFNFLLVFAEGDLLFTDTSNTQAPPKTQAFPVFGFGAGARGTIHATDRFAFFGEASVGLMKADIEKNGLTNIGYKDAESLNPYFGAHLGVEWYQVDRHFAVGLLGGGRDVTGFKRQIGSDTPLAWDGGVSLRYTF